VFISEVLCFIRNNFDKLTCSELKTTLIDFYNDDELTHAKDMLLKSVTKALDEGGRGSELPRMPKRVGDKKNIHVADDLLKLFTIVDEQKLCIPSFVVYDLSRVPFLNADSFNMVSMMRKLETLEKRMNTMESCYIWDTATALTYSTVIPTTTTNGTAGAVSTDDFPPVSPPLNDGYWQTVTSKKKRQNEVSDTSAVSVPTGEANTTGSGHVQPRKSDSNRKVLGTRQANNNTTVTSGVAITQKSVIHIDNLHYNCTKDLLADYLLAADIHVLTCYPSKSWLRDGEREQVTAFRVCVPASERSRIMDPQLWSEGVVLRDWKFKKSNHGATAGHS